MDIIGGMRRLAFLLLLLAIPLQYSWAALGAYCQHGDSAGVQWHFGHHTHEHQHDHEQPAKKSGASSSHPDCAHHGSASLPQRPQLALCVPPALSVVDHEPDIALADLPPEPERPKWAAAG